MENLNKIYPMANRLKIKKRGRKDWNCLFYDDNPMFFDIFERIVGYEKIQELTNNAYIPF